MPPELEENPNEPQNQPPTPNLEQPPTNVPPPIDRNAQIIAAQQAVIADITRSNQEVIERLARLEQQRNEPAPLTPEKASEAFFANPAAMISEEIKKQLAPLNESAALLKRQSAYETLKIQMKRDPRFVALQNSNVESAMDQLVSEQREFNVQQTVRDYYTAIGTVAANGGFNNSSETPPNNTPPTQPTVNTPPHLRPSAPPPRSVEPPKAKLRELTENEKRLARLYNMTDAEYLAGQGLNITESLEIPTFQPPKV